MNDKGKKTIFSFAFTVAIVIGLCACNLPQAGITISGVATIKEVSITPPSGTGTFHLLLRYHRNLTTDVTISCYYVTPDGATMGIASYTDNGKTMPDQERTKDFTVTPPVTGVYTATCEDESGTSSLSQTFMVDDNPDADVKILEVRVKNLSSRDAFSMEVAYVIRVSRDVSFTCYYASPDDVTTIIKFTETGMIQEFPRVLTHAARFSVAGTDGSIKGGVYTATCVDDEGISSKSTSFSVAGDPTPTTVPAPLTTPTLSLLLGKITFSLGTYQSTRPSGGGELDDVTRWCIPEVTIAADDTLSGTCEFTGQTAHLTESTIRATITGKAVRGGAFNFTYNVIETGPNGWKLGQDFPGVDITSEAAQWYVFYTGTGNFTSPTQAAGVANFDYTCMSGASNLLWCSGQEMETFKGTINWNFEP